MILFSPMATFVTSPTISAIFAPGKTSRINVAHFMASLITDPTLWNKWRGQIPVVYEEEKVREKKSIYKKILHHR